MPRRACSGDLLIGKKCREAPREYTGREEALAEGAFALRPANPALLSEKTCCLRQQFAGRVLAGAEISAQLMTNCTNIVTPLSSFPD